MLTIKINLNEGTLYKFTEKQEFFDKAELPGRKG